MAWSSWASRKSVTTSGRQTQMRATKVETIVTDYSYGSASGGLGGATGGAASSSGTVINTAAATTVVQPVTTPMEIGPTLDVVPYVLSDDYTINMTIIPELLEFNGYDTPTLPPITGIANVQIIPAVLPDFTVRSVVTTVNVWDNQTVVLGGLISSTDSDDQGQGAVSGGFAAGRPAVSKPVQEHNQAKPDDFCDGHDSGSGGQPHAFGRRAAVQPGDDSGAAGGERERHWADDDSTTREQSVGRGGGHAGKIKIKKPRMNTDAHG